MMRLFRLCILLAAISLPEWVCAQELLVIVSANNPTHSLQAQQVADIFLGQSARFPDGSEARAIDQGVGSVIRDNFYGQVTSKSPALVKAYWTKMIFTGRGQPPKEVNGSLAIRKLVAENPNMIGYIDKSALDSSVKVVLVVH